jgi:hypothetical protein
LDVFSGQGDQIEPIPFALSHASWDTSLDYPQRIITRSLKFHFFEVDPPFRDPQKYLLMKKNCFPVFSYILVTTLDTCCY